MTEKAWILIDSQGNRASALCSTRKSLMSTYSIQLPWKAFLEYVEKKGFKVVRATVTWNEADALERKPL